MALALSLSLDLFLMKGNLLIAVKAQPETNKGGRRQNKPKRGGGKESKRKKKRAEHRGMVNVVTERNGRDAESTDLLTRQTKSTTIHNTQTVMVYSTIHWWISMMGLSPGSILFPISWGFAEAASRI